MKKVFIVAFAALGFLASNDVKAQEGEITIGVQGMLLSVTSTVEEGSGSYSGFNLFGKYGVTDNINVGLNIGMAFNSTEFSAFGSTSKSSSRITPITIFADYTFLDDEFRPFVGLDLGIYNVFSSVETDFLGSPVDVSGSENYFGVAPQAGVLYFLNDNLSINANIKYHILPTEGATNFIGIAIGASWTLD